MFYVRRNNLQILSRENDAEPAGEPSDIQTLGVSLADRKIAATEGMPAIRSLDGVSEVVLELWADRRNGQSWDQKESAVQTKSLSVAFLISLMASINLAMVAAAERTPPRRVRAAPPARDPNTPGYVQAKELPDGTIPPADADGNFIIGPTHQRASEMSAHEGVPKGTVHDLTMSSADSKIYPGIARQPNTSGTVDPADPTNLVVTTSHPAPYTRRVAVYVPQQYVPGTAAPFIVGADGPDRSLFTALDNLIAQHRVPAMIAISIGNGSGDAQGSQRGLEYDTMSGLYAEFVEKEVLPLVETQCHVKLTKDPEGRATTGCSSGGSCAMIMAWYHPELYHRVLTYSGTFPL